MGRAKIIIPKDELRRLYEKEKWSPCKIADRYRCDAVTVRTRLIEAGIPLKTKSAAQTKYPRSDYDGTDDDKSYMLGFRYGDLNAYMPKGRSETIVVRSHSTIQEQCDVFSDLFKKYGSIVISRNKNKIQMTCYLNTTFTFLLDKYPPSMRQWIASNPKRMSAFSAGYVDAEGTFGINQGKGRFKVDSYDYQILLDMHAFLCKQSLNVKLRRIALKGENDYGWLWKEDVWRLEINEAASLEQLIDILQPHMRHGKRIADSEKVLQNIAQRRHNGSIA